METVVETVVDLFCAVVPAVARAVINAACASDHAAVGMF